MLMAYHGFGCRLDSGFVLVPPCPRLDQDPGQHLSCFWCGCSSDFSNRQRHPRPFLSFSPGPLAELHALLLVRTPCCAAVRAPERGLCPALGRCPQMTRHPSYCSVSGTGCVRASFSMTLLLSICHWTNAVR